jgi:hypothetical protein
MSLDDFERNIADPVNALADGHHIDLVGYRNVSLMHKENLGKGISDHPAMKYEFLPD